MLLDTMQAKLATQPAMGTIMTHKVFGQYAEECLSEICYEIDRLEKILSRFMPDSDISRINHSAGMHCETISYDTFEILSRSVEFSRQCQGYFDITVGPLVNIWGEHKDSFTVPDDASIRKILPLVNYRDLILDPGEMTARLRYAGQSVDLGGIGKGFAGDRILEIYREFGIISAYSNLGGNVVTLGAKLDGTPWRIGIQHPRQENCLIGSVAVIGQTVVTSGDYQRYFTDRQGKRRHHILDPRSGYPSDSGLISVSIVTENPLTADALSTILFIAGLEKGLGFLNNYKQTEAILVDSDLRVYITQGLRYRFQAENDLKVTILD